MSTCHHFLSLRRLVSSRQNRLLFSLRTLSITARTNCVVVGTILMGGTLRTKLPIKNTSLHFQMHFLMNSRHMQLNQPTSTYSIIVCLQFTLVPTKRTQSTLALLNDLIVFKFKKLFINTEFSEYTHSDQLLDKDWQMIQMDPTPKQFRLLVACSRVTGWYLWKTET